MQQNQAYLANEKLGRLMGKYAVPCIISLLVGALYNIVDQIFIANADYLGSYGNAANTVVFPLTVIALAVAVMIGDGCCAFVSLSMGRNKPADASQSMGNAIVLTIAASLVLTAVYLIFMDGIIAIFGGKVNAETFRCSKEYFFWITVGIPFYMFGQAMNPVIRADGSPKFAMVSTVIGALINIVLDPIMIYGLLGCPKMGMAGAAIATVAGQIVTAALSLGYLCRTKSVRLSRADFRLSGGVVKASLGLGLCGFLSQISLVVAMAAINNMLRKYGALDAVFGQAQYAQIPMAVVGIVMKFFQIVISIVVGLAAGCLPIVGFNMGTNLKARVKRLFTMLLVAEAAVDLAAFAVIEFWPRAIIGVFGAANESAYYTEFAVKAFRTYLVFIVLACVNKAAFIFLQAMGKALASTLLSMVREIIFGAGFALLLPRFFGLDGVLYVSDKHLDLAVQTMFANVKKGNLATLTDEQASVNTPEAGRGTVSDSNITQGNETVNPKSEEQASTREKSSEGKSSRRDVATDDTAEELRGRQESYADLRRQNAKLKAQAEYWRGQTRETKGAAIRKTDTDAFARRLTEQLYNKGAAEDVKAELKEMGDYIVQTDGKVQFMKAGNIR